MKKPNKVMMIVHSQTPITQDWERLVIFLQATGAHVCVLILLPEISLTIRSALSKNDMENIDKKSLREAEKTKEVIQVFFDNNRISSSAEIITVQDVSNENFEELTQDKQIDWVVKIAHQESLKMSLHSFDKALLRFCKLPIWLLRKANNQKSPLAILGAVDVPSHHGKPEDLNHDILQTTLAFAKFFEQQPQLINVYPNIPEEIIEQHSNESIEAYVARIRDSQKAPLNELAKQYGIRGENLHFQQGDAAKEIANHTNQQENMILIIGTVGRKGLSGFLYGNTAERVVMHTTCDLIALKPV